MGFFRKLLSIFTRRKTAPILQNPNRPTEFLQILPAEISPTPSQSPPSEVAQVVPPEPMPPEPMPPEPMPPEPMPPEPMPPEPINPNNSAIEIAEFINTADPGLNVPEDDVTKRVREYAYVLNVDPAHLRPFVPWWQQESHQQHWEKRSYEAYAWMEPFVSLIDTNQLEPLHKAVQRGVRDVKSVPYALREIIRSKRRTKEPHQDLLQALYGACVLVDFVASLDVECQLFFNDLRPFVDASDLKCVQCDYLTMGYQQIASLNSTDVKWLVSEFGEPIAHKPYGFRFSPVIQNAVGRFCRAELRRNNREIKTDVEVEQALPRWLHHQVESSLRIHNESQKYAASIQARHDQQAVRELHGKNCYKSPTPISTSPSFISVCADATSDGGEIGAGAMPDSAFDAEVNARMRDLAYIVDADLPPLPDDKQWGGFHAHRNCTNEGLDKFHRWLDPFLAPGVAKLTSLKSVHEVGPHQTYGIVIALRRLIKTRKKNESPHDDLLHALFGLCLMRDFACSFVVDGIPMPDPAVMVEFVDIDELRAVKCDFATVGYQHCGSLLKTDIKWLVAAFGEPVEHKSPDMLFQFVRNRAIGRYCRTELRRLVLSANSVGVLPAFSMRDWLEEKIKNSIASRKKSEAWAVEQEKITKQVATARTATLGTYIIADLETTALNPKTGEILELVAVQVDSVGVVTEKFFALISVNQRVPTLITELTGIIQVDVERDGYPLAEALADFFAFVGTRPIFIHNVQINAVFLSKAASQVGLNLINPIHDISHVYQDELSTGRTYKSNVSVTDSGATESSHRSFKAAASDLALFASARVDARKKRNVKVPKKSQTEVLHWPPTGAFSVSVVGTSYYCDAIEKLVKNSPGKRSLVYCTASFVPESTNIHDSNAVMVMIEDEKVGYLLREFAVTFRSYFEKFGLAVQVTTCDAVISNQIESHGAQDSYRIALDLAKEPTAPKAIAPTYPVIERIELIPDPPLILSKQDDGRYFVEVCLDCSVFDDMDRQKRLMTWTTNHWDTINYYLGNKKNAGLGHLLFAVPKSTHKELFGDMEPDAKLEVIKGCMALVSLKPVA